MKYKLIAMDMDGTLLNNQGKITEKTKQALQKAAASGCYITLSTGRSLPALQHFLPELPINAPLILYNGAMVAKTDGTILFHEPLKEKDAAAVLSSPYAPEDVILWQNNLLFLSRHSDKTAYYERAVKMTGNIFQTSSFSNITKLLWIDEADSLQKRKAALSGSLPDTVSYCNSRHDFLEFFSGSVSKGTALRFLCKHMEIRPEETIAFGDGENDISLLQAAGLSVAMENAAEEIMTCADYITASNDEDGIALFIQSFT